MAISVWCARIPGLTQPGMYSIRKGLEACNFGFKKKGNHTIGSCFSYMFKIGYLDPMFV